MKKIMVLSGILFSVGFCMAQQKPAKTKLPPPKVEMVKFTPPKVKKDTKKTQNPKFAPPVIRKDS